MVNDGANRVRPVWFESKKFKYIGISILGLCACIAAGLLIFQPPQHTNPIKPTLSHAPVLTPSTTIHLRAVGDVMLGRSVATRMAKYQNWSWPFDETFPRLPPVDSTIGNLEAPIIQSCPSTDEGMIFCAPKAALEGLAKAEFSLLSLANNHTYNHGLDGYQETKQLLTETSIKNIGNGETVTQQINGETIGFLALDDISSAVDIKKVNAMLADLAQQSNSVIVLIHWGNEYESKPSVRQKSLASEMISHGATIILGTHPHVLQPIVTEGNSLVVYSLGNFIFDQMWSQPTRKGMILDIDLTFENHQLKKITYQPIHTTIYDYGQPRIDDDQ